MCVLTGKAIHHRAVDCARTWLRRFPDYQFHGTEPYAGTEIKIEQVGVREGHYSCFEKRFNGLKKVHAETNNLWIGCFSDDNYVWRHAVEALVKIHDPHVPQLITYRHGHETVNGFWFNLPMGGAGYVLSRSALTVIMQNLDRLTKDWLSETATKEKPEGLKHEDIFMGYVIAKLGIKMTFHEGFCGWNPAPVVPYDHVHPPVYTCPPLLSAHHVYAPQIYRLEEAYPDIPDEFKKVMIPGRAR